MTSRLPWQRNPEGGYIAYPDGPEHKRRVAKVYYEVTSSTKWRWQVNYDDAVDGGNQHTKQEAADRATEAWPACVLQGEKLAALKAADEALVALFKRQALTGTVPIEEFRIPERSSKHLLRIIWLGTEGFRARAGALASRRLPPHLEATLAACSAELYRRRVQQAGTTTEGSGGPVRT